MKDFKSASASERVRYLEQKFMEGLGEARVRTEKEGVLLLFDLNDPVQMEEFNHLGEAIHTIFNSLPGNKMEARIPGEQQEPLELLTLARRMASPSIRKDDKEVVRRIVRGDPEHVIASLTKTPWNLVEGSPYDNKVLEPVQEGIELTDDVRRKQELALGFVLHDDSRATGLLTEWLDHQREVERRNGMKPRMVLPEEWASTQGIDRAVRFKVEHPKRPLAKLFGRE